MKWNSKNRFLRCPETESIKYQMELDKKDEVVTTAAAAAVAAAAEQREKMQIISTFDFSFGNVSTDAGYTGMD